MSGTGTGSETLNVVKDAFVLGCEIIGGGTAAVTNSMHACSAMIGVLTKAQVEHLTGGQHLNPHAERYGSQLCHPTSSLLFCPVCCRPRSILVNCAGRFLDERFALTPEGIEQTMAVDFYAHTLITLELLNTLSRNGPSRIVNVSRWVVRYPTATLATDLS